MTKLRNSELAVLGVERRIGATFETDMLDVHLQRYEVVALLTDGVTVKRVSWSQRPPPPSGREETDDESGR